MLLPPVFGCPLYDGGMAKFVNARMSVRDQEMVDDEWLRTSF